MFWALWGGCGKLWIDAEGWCRRHLQFAVGICVPCRQPHFTVALSLLWCFVSSNFTQRLFYQHTPQALRKKQEVEREYLKNKLEAKKRERMLKRPQLQQSVSVESTGQSKSTADNGKYRMPGESCLRKGWCRIIQGPRDKIENSLMSFWVRVKPPMDVNHAFRIAPTWITNSLSPCGCEFSCWVSLKREKRFVRTRQWQGFELPGFTVQLSSTSGGRETRKGSLPANVPVGKATIIKSQNSSQTATGSNFTGSDKKGAPWQIRVRLIQLRRSMNNHLKFSATSGKNVYVVEMNFFKTDVLLCRVGTDWLGFR